MPEPEITVTELLARITAGREQLDVLLASPPATPEGAWTAKDHMSHIAAWEGSALALLNGEPRMGHVGLDQKAYRSLGEDGINEHIRATFADKSDAEVRGEYESAHAALVARLEGMTDEDLKLPYSHYQPDDPPYNARPVWPWIVGNTVEHYAEHIRILSGGTH